MIYFTDSDVVRAAQGADLLAAIEGAFRGSGEMPARLRCDVAAAGGPKLLIMPGWGGGAMGVKVATITEKNRADGLSTFDGMYLLFDGNSGRAVAVMAGTALTELRTAAVSALASRYLSRSNSRTLLFIGTGALAPFLVRAHVGVRPIERVLVWGRSPEKAAAVVEQLVELPCTVSVVQDLTEAIPHADIISAATSSSDPLIQAALVRPGTHVDLVGSFTPEMHEAESALFARSRVVVDTRRAFEESGDLVAAVTAKSLIPAKCDTLHDLAARGRSARRCGTEITVFKSIGTAVADLAVATLIAASGRGTKV